MPVPMADPYTFIPDTDHNAVPGGVSRAVWFHRKNSLIYLAVID
jgi:hypothetical protein